MKRFFNLDKKIVIVEFLKRADQAKKGNTFKAIDVVGFKGKDIRASLEDIDDPHGKVYVQIYTNDRSETVILFNNKWKELSEIEQLFMMRKIEVLIPIEFLCRKTNMADWDLEILTDKLALLALTDDEDLRVKNEIMIPIYSWVTDIDNNIDNNYVEHVITRRESMFSWY